MVSTCLYSSVSGCCGDSDFDRADVIEDGGDYVVVAVVVVVVVVAMVGAIFVVVVPVVVVVAVAVRQNDEAGGCHRGYLG